MILMMAFCLPVTAKAASGSLQLSALSETVSKGSQVMLETVDPYSPEFAPFRIPQFDEQKKLPVMQDTDGTVGYAISDIEVEKKLGTVDAALDSILAIQNSLMGGNV